MFEYMSFSEDEKHEEEEIGEEPRSYADAIRLLDRFIDLARDEVTSALNTPSFPISATEIYIRAETFALLLRPEDDNEKDQRHVGYA